MRTIPGMVVMNPSDDVEAKAAVKAALDHEGPVYIRFGRLAVPVINDNPDYKFELGKGVVLREGKDVTLIATGLEVSETLVAAEKLAQDGIRTAFACTADDFALDIMKYLKEKGLRTPADYGIVGFDNVDTLKYITPQLVTVSNKVDAVAKAAVQMLFALINAGQEQAEEKSQVAEQEAQRRVQILPHELIDGETL